MSCFPGCCWFNCHRRSARCRRCHHWWLCYDLVSATRVRSQRLFLHRRQLGIQKPRLVTASRTSKSASVLCCSTTMDLTNNIVCVYKYLCTTTAPKASKSHELQRCPSYGGSRHAAWIIWSEESPSLLTDVTWILIPKKEQITKPRHEHGRQPIATTATTFWSDSISISAKHVDLWSAATTHCRTYSGNCSVWRFFATHKKSPKSLSTSLLAINKLAGARLILAQRLGRHLWARHILAKCAASSQKK